MIVSSRVTKFSERGYYSFILTASCKENEYTQVVPINRLQQKAEDCFRWNKKVSDEIKSVFSTICCSTWVSYFFYRRVEFPIKSFL